jgi:hypothetical protein
MQEKKSPWDAHLENPEVAFLREMPPVHDYNPAYNAISAAGERQQNQSVI